MERRLINNSVSIQYIGYDIEIIKDGLSNYVQELTGIKDDVLTIAAKSRGWNTQEDINHVKKHFRIDALFKADGLALIWKKEKLYGLGGIAYNWNLADKFIIHFCSVSFLPEIQKTGLFPLLFLMAWKIVFSNKQFLNSFFNENAYATVITQSPFIFDFFCKFFNSFPSPYKQKPTPDKIEVAKHVVDRFDGHLEFDKNKFIIRNECNFTYNKVPFCKNNDVNKYFKEKLRINEGDVFVVVGKLEPDKIIKFIERMNTRYTI